MTTENEFFRALKLLEGRAQRIPLPDVLILKAWEFVDEATTCTEHTAEIEERALGTQTYLTPYPNQVAEPDFDASLTGWNELTDAGHTGTYTQETIQGLAFAEQGDMASVKIECTDGDTAGNAMNLFCDNMPALPSEVWDFEAYALVTALSGMEAKVRVQWLNSGLGNLGATNAVAITAVNSEFTQIKLENQTAPANTAFARLFLRLETSVAPNATGVVYFGKPRAERAAGATITARANRIIAGEWVCHSPILILGSDITVATDLFEQPLSYQDQRQGAVAPDGTLYIAYVAGRNPGDGSRRHVVVEVSTDDGATWSELAVVSDNTGASSPQRAPDIVCDSQNNLWVLWYDSGSVDGIYIRKYDPSTTTWTPALTSSGTIISSPEGDHPSISIDPDDDDYLLICWETYDYVTSDDGGATFSSVGTFGSVKSSSRPQCLILEAGVAASTGRWFICQGSTGVTGWFTSNSGSSWANVIEPDTGATFRGYPSCCRDSSDNIHMVYMADTSGVTEIRYVTGDSNGDNWTSPVSINARASWYQNFPSVAVDGNDTLYVSWFESDVYDPGTPYSNTPGGGADWLGKEVQVFYKETGGSWTSLASYTADSKNVFAGLSFHNRGPGGNKLLLTYGKIVNTPPGPANPTEAHAVLGKL